MCYTFYRRTRRLVRGFAEIPANLCAKAIHDATFSADEDVFKSIDTSFFCA
jgi:hypothetical protein